MKKIALIGAGQLGSRHLQGLAKMDIPVQLYVADPSSESVNLAKQRFSEIPPNKNICSIFFTTDMDDIPLYIDLCIIATTSQIRFEVLKQFLKDRKVSYLILEKVVFQSVQEFEEAEDILNKRKIKCWINCPRRMVPFYQGIRDTFKDNPVIEYKVCGGNWGLGCNSIHFIDHLAFFTNDVSYNLNISGLDPCVYPSKRKDFFEFTGTLSGYFSKGSKISLVSVANSDSLPEITIISSNVKMLINETAGVAKVSKNQKDDQVKFSFPYQSDLTNLAAKEILETGSSSLTCFKDSFALHVPMLNGLIKHLEHVEKRPYSFCPIT